MRHVQSLLQEVELLWLLRQLFATCSNLIFCKFGSWVVKFATSLFSSSVTKHFARFCCPFFLTLSCAWIFMSDSNALYIIKVTPNTQDRQLTISCYWSSLIFCTSNGQFWWWGQRQWIRNGCWSSSGMGIIAKFICTQILQNKSFVGTGRPDQCRTSQLANKNRLFF